MAPVFLALVFGVLDFGRAIWLGQAVSASSREASRYGIGNAATSGVPQYLDCAGIRDAARAKVPDAELTDADVDVGYLHTDGSTSVCESSPVIYDGDRVVVTVRAVHDWMMPFNPLDALTLSTTDRRSIHNGVSRP